MRGAVSLLQDSRLFTRGAVLNWFRRRSRCQVVAYDCTVDVGRSHGGDRRRHATMSFNMTLLSSAAQNLNNDRLNKQNKQTALAAL